MEATLAERGQVVIPKAIRDQLGLTPGTLLTFAVELAEAMLARFHDPADGGRAQKSYAAEGQNGRKNGVLWRAG